MASGFVSINDFMRPSIIFYHSVGINPYESESNKDTMSRRRLAVFLFHLINLNFVFGLEVGYVSLYFTEDFVGSCMVTGYIVFVIVGELKLLTVYWQKKELNSLMREMEELFPAATAEKQQQYQVAYYRKRCAMYTIGFACLHVVMVVTYNLFMIVKYIVQSSIHHVPNVKMSLPYSEYSPWSLESVLAFCLMYIQQAIAGYTCTAGHTSSDILIYALVMQSNMHFDYLSKTLTEMQIQAGRSPDGYKQDLTTLKELICYHEKLLRLIEVINKVFGVPLLLNFFASSLLVCFLGFQMTIGLSPDVICKLAVLFIATMVQIYNICFFSEMLITASLNVADAVYNMDWTSADKRCTKMLIIMAQRAQRPVCLRATVFLDISMETMTMFLKMSYRFFCVIRTMYV